MVTTTAGQDGIRFYSPEDGEIKDIIVQYHGDRPVGVQLRIMESNDDRLVAHTHYDPGIVLHRHSHASDSLIYILEGEVEIDGRSCPAGTQIVLPKDAPIGPLIAGPEGCTFIESYAGDITARSHDEEGYSKMLAERGIRLVPEAAAEWPHDDS